MSIMKRWPNVQPIREACTAVTMLCLGLGWWLHFSGGDVATSQGLLETALVAVIAGEVYAKD